MPLRSGRFPRYHSGMHRALALLLAASPVSAGEAVRDAALVVVALRQTRTAENRRDVLSVAFDSARPARQPVDPPESSGARVRRQNWFIPVYTGSLPDGAASELEVRPPASAPEPADRLGDAFQASLYPWRALLDAAWGGSWGATATTAIDILRGGQAR